MNHPKIIAVAAALTAIFMLAMNAASRAEEVNCPPGIRACKIITLAPDEINSLTGPGGIFDAAEFANRMQLTGPIQYWRNKLAAAPEVKGKPPVEPPKKIEPKPEAKK